MATGVPKTQWGTTAPPDSPTGPATWDVTLSYPGKKPLAEALATSPASLTSAWRGNPATNRLYFGDNLPILAHLLNDPAVRGQVRLIYIDPPFATQSVFLARNQNAAYADLLEGGHYLEFLRERLILLRELLSDDGSIYVHLDDNMAFHAKALMDEIFGPDNFRNWITRKKCNPKNYTRNAYGNVADYILFYTKSKNYVWNRPYDAWSAERADKEYPYTDERTGRKYKKVPLHAPGERRGATGQPWRGLNPPPGKHWQYPPATLDEMDARGDIYWSPNGNPRRKIYLDDSAGVPAQDIWLDFRDAHNQNIAITGYPTEKNPALLERIIRASSSPGDWVLDAFAGSGTTPYVAAQHNRRWLAIDHSPEALQTMLKRFAHGTQPMGDFVQARLAQPTSLPLALPLFRVTDFELLSAQPAETSLTALVEQWQNWLSNSM